MSVQLRRARAACCRCRWRRTEVVVATAEPFVTDWVRRDRGAHAQAACAGGGQPAGHRSATRPSSSRWPSRCARRRRPASNAGAASFEQLVELGKSNKQLDANDQGVVQVVDWLWQYAFDQRASDIHLEPRREHGRDPLSHRRRAAPRLPDADDGDERDDGAHQAARPHGRGREAPAAGRPHQDRAPTAASEVEMRLSTLPTAFGEKMVMRIFDPDTAVKTSTRSASAPHDARALGAADHAAARHHPGDRPDRQRQDHHAVLHAEAAGHRRGQRLHDRRPDRDDRAGLQPDAGAARSSTSASPKALRALMRQDPDIIMVGEIRDLATAEMAIQAALTGHLVFSTCTPTMRPRRSRA